MTVNLPESVLALAEFSPLEDIALAILREGLVDVPIYSLIPEDADDFFIVCRRRPALGDWDGDPRFTDEARLELHIFARDPDGDEKASILAEAARVVLRNAWLSHKNYPGLGSVIRIQQVSDPARKTDWATSTGPVQYADLPTGYWRYESTYEMWIRRPRD